MVAATIAFRRKVRYPPSARTRRESPLPALIRTARANITIPPSTQWQIQRGKDRRRHGATEQLDRASPRA